TQYLPAPPAPWLVQPHLPGRAAIFISAFTDAPSASSGSGFRPALDGRRCQTRRCIVVEPGSRRSPASGAEAPDADSLRPPVRPPIASRVPGDRIERPV